MASRSPLLHAAQKSRTTSMASGMFGTLLLMRGFTPMTYEDIQVTRHGDVEVITLNRPDVRNALRFRTYDELERSVRTTTSRCLVITGADPAFCSGDDVLQVMGGRAATHPVEVVNRLTPAADALLNTDVPVISAVNGA